ncbi:SAM-dependent chlorinase/fluorinase [Candidatus Poribacteria bacterium]|nr:SAM-dependent chlorinase/fluorinase [Candidatus Poribacteria bacterium]
MITLMTDFGTSDHYVGVMKGVILNINPQVEIVDITHTVPPQDVHAAAFLIDSAYRYFPTGTIHVIVVDPGVGSGRRAIVCRTKTAYFVCPDNGILTHILRNEERIHTVAVKNSAYFLPQVSNTFHGRDIFAPIAAHLSHGIGIDKLGSPVAESVQLPIPKPQVTDNTIIGQVIWIDAFGNLITNISQEILESLEGRDSVVIRAGSTEIDHFNRSYAESAVGDALAIVGSFNRLEISINQGNAAQVLGLQRGDRVTICVT